MQIRTLHAHLPVDDGVVASSKSNGRKLAETTTSASAPLKATKGHYSLPLL